MRGQEGSGGTLDPTGATAPVAEESSGLVSLGTREGGLEGRGLRRGGSEDEGEETETGGEEGGETGGGGTDLAAGEEVATGRRDRDIFARSHANSSINVSFSNAFFFSFPVGRLF